MTSTRNPETIKTCHCCGTDYTLATWRNLPLVGVQHVPADEEGPAVNCEMRDCNCLAHPTTLGVEFDMNGELVEVENA